jgi:hypothetical protein
MHNGKAWANGIVSDPDKNSNCRTLGHRACMSDTTSALSCASGTDRCVRRGSDGTSAQNAVGSTAIAKRNVTVCSAVCALTRAKSARTSSTLRLGSDSQRSPEERRMQAVSRPVQLSSRTQLSWQKFRNFH